MIHNVQHMLQMMRAGLNEDIEYPGTPYDVEMNRLDNAQDLLYRKIRQLRPSLLAHYYTLPLTGASEYALPFMSPTNYCEILMVVDATDTTSMADTVATYWSDRMLWQEGMVESGRVVYSIRDKIIELPQKNSGVTLRIWYARKPVGLLYGTVGSGSTSTTIVFPTTPTAPTSGVPVPKDDYYNGMCVECNSEVFPITDYVTSTKTATIDGTWLTTPLNTHTMSLISPLPEQYHHLIVELAKRYGKIDKDDDDTYLIREIGMEEETMNAEFARENRHRQRSIKRIPRI